MRDLLDRCGDVWEADTFLGGGQNWSVQVAEWLALPASDHEVRGLSPAKGRIKLMNVQRLIAQSLSLSSFHYLNMT